MPKSSIPSTQYGGTGRYMYQAEIVTKRRSRCYLERIITTEWYSGCVMLSNHSRQKWISSSVAWGGRPAWYTSTNLLSFITACNSEGHIDHLDQILNLLEWAGVMHKLKKCYIFKGHVNYLGNVLLLGYLALAKRNSSNLERYTFNQDKMWLSMFMT